MKTIESFITSFLAIYIIAAFVLAIGWVMNITTILGSLSGPVDALFIARCVGVIVAPFGGILGYF